jgi:ribosomal protein S18 acetylase RimI-like enzyme
MGGSRVFAVFFKSAFEGQGIGKALMEATESGLRSAGVTEVWLYTGADPNLRAVGFYRNSGWYASGYLDDGQIVFKKNLKNGEKGRTNFLPFPLLA